MVANKKYYLVLMDFNGTFGQPRTYKIWSYIKSRRFTTGQAWKYIRNNKNNPTFSGRLGQNANFCDTFETIKFQYGHPGKVTDRYGAFGYTKLFGYKAIEMIIRGYQAIVAKGKDDRIPLMEDFLIASNYAGIAFGTAGCAAVHAMSYPLGGQYHVPHGESNYAMFTGVLKNYMEIKQDGEIAVMNRFLASLLDCGETKMYDKLEELLNQILPKKALREYGMKEHELAEFTDSVIASQGRLMANNFVPLDRDRVYKIYSELY